MCTSRCRHAARRLAVSRLAVCKQSHSRSLSSVTGSQNRKSKGGNPNETSKNIREANSTSSSLLKSAEKFKPRSSPISLENTSSFAHLWHQDDDTQSQLSHQSSSSPPSPYLSTPPPAPVAPFDHRTFPVPVGANSSRRGERQGRFKLFQLPRMTARALLRHRYAKHQTHRDLTSYFPLTLSVLSWWQRPSRICTSYVTQTDRSVFH